MIVSRGAKVVFSIYGGVFQLVSRAVLMIYAGALC